MARERVTAWAQRSIALGAGWLVAWHVAALADAPGRTLVALALQGFVLHVAVGKAYSLVPSYFDRRFEHPLVPAVQVPLTAAGAALLAAGPWLGRQSTSLPADDLAAAGAALWAAGIALFVAGLLWTVRGNLSGAATATGDANADRAGVDRVANAAMPVALAYLLVGAYATAAPGVGLPPVVDGYPPRATHLVAAGFGALLLFAVGFRLLPRFTVTHPPRGAVWAVVPAGAVGPLLVAVGIPGGPLLHAGAAVEAVAVVGFAATVGALGLRTDRDRVGLYGVYAAAAAGVAAAALGVWMAVTGMTPGAAGAHRRLNLLGLLGLSVVGVAYQFYPPSVGSHRVATDGWALVSIAALSAGLALQAAGLVAGAALAVVAGEVLGAVGAVLFAALVVGALVERGALAG